MLLHTPAELRKLHKQRLDELLELTESANYLSKMLGVPWSVSREWIRRGRISKRGARLVDSHPTLGKHFTAEYLRPEINA